mgnify:CR=1 FL=1
MLSIGAKGYVSLSEDQARDALGERHSIDEFLERFQKRTEAADYYAFDKNLCRHRNALPKRFAVLRTFERQAPLLVGVGVIANGEKVTSAVYGSPAVAHKNAGRQALARLRGLEIAHEFDDILREAVDITHERAPHCVRRRLIRTGRQAHRPARTSRARSPTVTSAT